jgi:hypothetical protein
MRALLASRTDDEALKSLTLRPDGAFSDARADVVGEYPPSGLSATAARLLALLPPLPRDLNMQA